MVSSKSGTLNAASQQNEGSGWWMRTARSLFRAAGAALKQGLRQPGNSVSGVDGFTGPWETEQVDWAAAHRELLELAIRGALRGVLREFHELPATGSVASPGRLRAALKRFELRLPVPDEAQEMLTLNWLWGNCLEAELGVRTVRDIHLDRVTADQLTQVFGNWREVLSQLGIRIDERTTVRYELPTANRYDFPLDAEPGELFQVHVSAVFIEFQRYDRSQDSLLVDRGEVRKPFTDCQTTANGQQ